MYMKKQDLALNNQQWLISYKTKPNQTKMQIDFISRQMYQLEVYKITIPILVFPYPLG